jgi:cobalamin synthase
MSYEEKRTWVYLVAVTGAYAVYLAIILGRLQGRSVAEVPYAWVLLWTTVASAVASTAGTTLVETARPSDSRRSDVRDKEIYRFGEYVSRWFVVGGAAAAFFMALAKLDYFWIANVIYLGFVLWAIAASVVKLVAYRRGLSSLS